MSPEQAGGEATDARSDVYSLGSSRSLLTASAVRVLHRPALLVKQLVAEAAECVAEAADCPTDLAVAVSAVWRRRRRIAGLRRKRCKTHWRSPRNGSLVRPRPRGGAAAGTPLERFRRLVLSAIAWSSS